MRAIYGLLAAIAAFGFMSGEANAFVVSQTGPVITSKCNDGKTTEGCSWCTKNNGCYVVTKCDKGKCTVDHLPAKANPKGRGTAAAPIKTTTTGDKAPVATGKPVRSVPVAVQNNNGESSKKH